MESLGRLAGGIAHDFNNILAAILGYGELLLSDAAPGTEAYEGLQHIVHSSRRARDLVKQILAFSRKAELIHQPVDLRAVVVDGLRLLRASLPSTIELRERIAPGPLVVLGDASQLSQVLLNLGSNAEYVLRALGDGRLEVELERVQLDQDWARAIGLPMGAHARLVVRDSGRGIPTEVISKVFEPFFTTKPVGEGTGMGLAVVHGIVVAHGGAVRLDSSSRGTTFECFFPLVSTPVTVAVQREGESLRGSGRVLAVDDEQAIVNLLQRVLPRRGFEVVCLTSPVEALERFRAGPHDFDIVISDRTMPRMTGYALAAELHAIRPELPVIITSGQGGGPIDDEVEARAIFHLAKPFDVADLMRVIERARRGERLDDRA
jgi:CheY-like chemotaxis protein